MVRPRTFVVVVVVHRFKMCTYVVIASDEAVGVVNVYQTVGASRLEPQSTSIKGRVSVDPVESPEITTPFGLYVIGIALSRTSQNDDPGTVLAGGVGNGLGGGVGVGPGTKLELGVGNGVGGAGPGPGGTISAINSWNGPDCEASYPEIAT